jgi:hypothetical protein
MGRVSRFSPEKQVQDYETMTLLFSKIAMIIWLYFLFHIMIHTPFSQSISQMTNLGTKLVRNIFLIIIALIVITNCFFVVSPTERAIKITLGNLSNTVYREGFHFKIPFFQTITIVDLTIDRADAVAKSASKDLQNIVTTVAVNYQINEVDILSMYKLV